MKKSFLTFVNIFVLTNAHVLCFAQSELQFEVLRNFSGLGNRTVGEFVNGPNHYYSSANIFAGFKDSPATLFANESNGQLLLFYNSPLFLKDMEMKWQGPPRFTSEAALQNLSREVFNSLYPGGASICHFKTDWQGQNMTQSNVTVGSVYYADSEFENVPIHDNCIEVSKISLSRKTGLLEGLRLSYQGFVRDQIHLTRNAALEKGNSKEFRPTRTYPFSNRGKILNCEIMWVHDLRANASKQLKLYGKSRLIKAWIIRYEKKKAELWIDAINGSEIAAFDNEPR